MGEFNRLYGSKQIFETAANEYTIILRPFLSDTLEKYWAEGTEGTIDTLPTELLELIDREYRYIA